MKSMGKKLIIGSIIIMATLLLVYKGPSLAKYVYSSIWNYKLESEAIYLTSDSLSPSVTKNVNNLWDGSVIYLNVKNSINDSVISNVEIEYTIECEVIGDAGAHVSCKVNGEESNVATDVLPVSKKCVNRTTDMTDVSSFDEAACLSGGYSWDLQSVSKEASFELISDNPEYEIKDLLVNITLKSKNPYKKVLSGVYTLHKANIQENEITIDYMNEEDILSINNSYEVEKCVSLKWNPQDLVIKNSRNSFNSYVVDSEGYIKEIKIALQPKKTINYDFYKLAKELENIVEAFVIEETTGC